MKRALFLSLIIAALICITATVGSDSFARHSKEKAIGDQWDPNKNYDKIWTVQNDKSLDKNFDKSNAFGVQHRCDSGCEKCGAICKIYEYCPGCGAYFSSNAFDGKCDWCGKECCRLKGCEKCGNIQFSSGCGIGHCGNCKNGCGYDGAGYAFCRDCCHVDGCRKESCQSCIFPPKPCNPGIETAEELKLKIYRASMLDP